MPEEKKVARYDLLLEECLPDPSHPLYGKWKACNLEVEDRAARAWEYISGFCSLPGLRILDFGCGDGGVATYFAERGVRVTAADIDPKRIEHTRIRAHEKGVSMEVVALDEKGLFPGESESFDVILSLDVIEHVPDPEKTLAEMARLLKIKGLLILETANRLSPYWLLHDPHYQLPVISILPPSLAAPIVRWRWGFKNYYLNKLLSVPRLRSMFRQFDLEEVLSYPHLVSEKIRHPEKIVSIRKRAALKALQTLRLQGALRLSLSIVHFFTSNLIFVLTKRAQG